MDRVQDSTLEETLEEAVAYYQEMGYPSGLEALFWQLVRRVHWGWLMFWLRLHRWTLLLALLPDRFLSGCFGFSYYRRW